METSAEEMARNYIALRSELEQLTRKYEEDSKVIQSEMEAITHKLSHICEESGATSIKTKYGTIIRSMQTRYSTTDWGSYHEMVLKYNAPYLMQKRIMDSALRDFLEEHPEAYPPGLYTDNKYVISVRRPSVKA